MIITTLVKIAITHCISAARVERSSRPLDRVFVLGADSFAFEVIRGEVGDIRAIILGVVVSRWNATLA